MEYNKQTRRKLALASILLALVLMGCSLPGNLAGLLEPTPSPLPTATAPATATPAPTAASVAPPMDLVNLQEEIIGVYEQMGRGVVYITSRSYGYDFFLRPIPLEGSGSGIVYDREGHIITNYHVIENADELFVTLNEEITVPATVVGSDPSVDLAVIKVDVEPEQLHAIPLGESKALRVGQFVIAIGNPFGFERTLTVGVVSALGRVIESPDESFIGEVIQTDAAINPGNSGGPLLDLSGQVVGVNTAIFSPSQASAGIGFAVPVDTVRQVVPSLIEKGYYPHPWLGVRYVWPLTPERAAALNQAGMNVPVDQGLLIVEVVDGSPAAEAGLRGGWMQMRVGYTVLLIGGDVLTAVDGNPITSDTDLTRYLDLNTQVGQTIQLTVWRDGQEMTLPVTLTERPR